MRKIKKHPIKIRKWKMANTQSGFILGSKISALKFEDTVSLINSWTKEKKGKYICVCNTHSLVTAYNNPHFNKVLADADLCVPDGMPLVFALRKLGFRHQNRVDGPNLMLELCKVANYNQRRIFLYGGKEENLQRLKAKIHSDFPGVQIAGSISPPFRELNTEEEIEIINKINRSNADIIFVSLGCPKQETWMHKNRKQVNGVMIGVGAAFDFILGDIRRPPIFLQKIGLEWFFRFLAEPKRLFKRYAYNNPAFLYNYVKSYKKDHSKTWLENKLWK